MVLNFLINNIINGFINDRERLYLRDPKILRPDALKARCLKIHVGWLNFGRAIEAIEYNEY